MVPLEETWSDYDNQAIYGDYAVADGWPPVVTDLMAYLAGVSQQVANTSGVDYFLADQIGTTRALCDEDSVVSRQVVYTAFGEAVSLTGLGPGATPTRYGYAGAWGYQEHDVGSNGPGGGAGGSSASPDGLPDNWAFASPGPLFPFLHVGWRYYDPPTGRFFQRDPIGIRGGVNVYGYVRSGPTGFVDPLGLYSWDDFIIDITGGPTVDPWCKVCANFWDDPKKVDTASKVAAGVGIAAGAGAVALSCAGINYGIKIGIHGAHHFFPELGRKAVHIQVNWWRVGVKGSGGAGRLPIW